MGLSTVSDSANLLPLHLHCSVCVRACFYIHDHKYIFAYTQIHSNRARTPAPSMAGHNSWWENPPWRALIATGSAVQ